LRKNEIKKWEKSAGIENGFRADPTEFPNSQQPNPSSHRIPRPTAQEGHAPTPTPSKQLLPGSASPCRPRPQSLRRSPHPSLLRRLAAGGAPGPTPLLGSSSRSAARPAAPAASLSFRRRGVLATPGSVTPRQARRQGGGRRQRQAQLDELRAALELREPRHQHRRHQ